MTEEELCAKYLHFDEQIHEIYNEQQKLMDEYKKEHCPYKIGDIYVDTENASCYDRCRYKIVETNLSVGKGNNKIYIFGYIIKLEKVDAPFDDGYRYRNVSSRTFDENFVIESEFKSEMEE